jgi:hypothetical protein
VQPAAILSVLVDANTRAATASLMKFNSRLSDVDKQSGKTSKGLKTLAYAARVTAGAGGFAVLGLAIKKAVDEARDAEKTMKQTEAVLKSTGGIANVSAKQVERLAERLAMMAGVDDELIQKGENLLLTFKNIRNEAGKGNDIFNQTVKATLDMAAAMAAASGSEINLKSASIQVGKALNDPVKGLTSLVRVGVTFSESQQNIIKRLVETGHRMQAQKMILRELRSEFGGSAKANADAMDKLGAVVDNLFEKFGKQLIPVIEKVATWLVRFAIQMDKGRGAGGKFVNTMKDIWSVVKVVIDVLILWNTWLIKLPKLWIEVGKVAVRWTKAIANAVKDAFNFIKKIVGDVIAGILRRFATLFEVASKLPIIGDKFKGIADRVNRAADRVDRLGENIKRLPSKKEVKVMVKLALSDLASGNVSPLVDINQKNPFGGPMVEGIENRVRDWVKNNPDALFGVGGGLGSAKGAIGMVPGLASKFGLSISSFVRPGDPGFHGSGRAMDVAGSTGQMLKFAGFMASTFGSKLLELIHTPLGWGIDNGARVPLSYWGAATNADHYDHVHVAMQRGGKIGGAGTGDKIPAMLEPGEFVVNRRAAAAAGPSLEALNSGVARFRNGIQGRGEMTGLLGHLWGATGFDGRRPTWGTGTQEPWGEYQYGANRMLFSKRMMRALGRGQGPDGDPMFAFALQTILHEMAHSRQRPGMSRWEREGGADVWAQWAGQRIIPKMGIGFFGLDGYPGFASRVRKNRSPKWWQQTQFMQEGGWARTPINIAADAARKAGFKGRSLINMVAIAGRESSWNPKATNYTYPDHSIGLWQINQLAHKGRYGSDSALMDPYTNAKAAYALFQASGYQPWVGVGYGGASQFLDEARAAYLATKGGAAMNKARGKAKRPPGLQRTGPGHGKFRKGGYGDQFRQRGGPKNRDVFRQTAPGLDKITEQFRLPLALAGLTESTADDLALLKQQEGMLSHSLGVNLRNGNKAAAADLAEALGSTRDAIESLTQATEDNTQELRMLELENERLRQKLRFMGVSDKQMAEFTRTEAVRASRGARLPGRAGSMV